MRCPKCGKGTLKQIRRQVVGTKVVFTYKCNHCGYVHKITNYL